MRMWLIRAEHLCRKHLIAEHSECHMFAGHIDKGRSLRGFVVNNLVETEVLELRHDELAHEMLKRDFFHRTPWKPHKPLDQHVGAINIFEAARVLFDRCPDCLSSYRANTLQPGVPLEKLHLIPSALIPDYMVRIWENRHAKERLDLSDSKVRAWLENTWGSQEA